jgi:Flp pilus assembly protein TadG
VEAALVIPLILVVALACFEVVSVVSVRLDMVAAAREGARVAATVPAPERAVAVVREVLGNDLGRRAQVTVRRSAVVGSAAVVTVEVVQPLRTPLLSAVRVPLRVEATMRVER